MRILCGSTFPCFETTANTEDIHTNGHLNKTMQVVMCALRNKTNTTITGDSFDQFKHKRANTNNNSNDERSAPLARIN